ncbi:unnamed protein product [Caenorhabditis sp. 36 PRJEB53466]|nr:unnamed protein product [Caenorhabditis sp. 36 PRJEB53466]
MDASVSLSTKILCLKAHFHFLLISALYALLIVVFAAGVGYNYINFPKEMNGAPMSEEQIRDGKKGLLEGLGGYTVIPFVIVTFLSGLIVLVRNRNWFAMCAIITAIIALLTIGYNATVLVYFKMKYVWPPHLIYGMFETMKPLQAQKDQIIAQFQQHQQPIPDELKQEFDLEFMEKMSLVMMKVSVSVFTGVMFAIIPLQLYCVFVLVKMSFLYKPPAKPAPLRTVRVAPPSVRTEPVEPVEAEEPHPTGTENGTDADKSGIGTGAEVLAADQTGTGTGGMEAEEGDGKKNSKKSVKK